jgi:uncharacterized protein YbjQ (UPF0145 family)
MRKIAFIEILNLLLVPQVIARDTIASYSIEEAMSLEKSKSALDSDISFYFGEQKHGKAE